MICARIVCRKPFKQPGVCIYIYIYIYIPSNYQKSLICNKTQPIKAQ